MSEQALTVNIHHPQVLRATKISEETTSVTLSNGRYHGQVSMIFSDEHEALLFARDVIEKIQTLGGKK